MQPEDAKELVARSQIIHSEQTVQNALASVAGRIREELCDKNPLVLCVMKGGLFYCGQLLMLLDFPLELDYLHVTRYRQSATGGRLAWRSAPWVSVKGRQVLVVDDILDAGLTLDVIYERIMQMGAAKVWSTVFVDKLNGQQKPIAADFVGLQVPDRFVFGFGMDVDGAWRHLPAIYACPADYVLPND